MVQSMHWHIKTPLNEEEERYLVGAYKTGQILQLVVPGHPVNATRPKDRRVGVHERRDAFQLVRPAE
jgi:hypothetical protein